MEFINLKAQYAAYKDEIDGAVQRVCADAAFIMGGEVERLETALANYTGAAHAFTCSSGTDALLLALMALGIGRGDEVITTPFTFIATAEAIALAGATTVFVDIDLRDCNINAALIERAITPKTKAILPVSLYGQCADMAAINALAVRYNLAVIEDGCQSFGAVFCGSDHGGDHSNGDENGGKISLAGALHGKKSGNLSTIGTTSFFPSKPLGCYGDGGAVFTNDTELAARLAMLRNHGQSARYEHKVVGINGRLDAIQAAILNVKLRHFDAELARRTELRSRYDRLLARVGGVTVVGEGAKSVTAQYSVRVANRDAVAAALFAKSVPTAVHYPKPLHLQEAFASLGYKRGDFPQSEQAADEVLSLPFSPFLTEGEQDAVADALQAVITAIKDASKDARNDASKDTFNTARKAAPC